MMLVPAPQESSLTLMPTNVAVDPILTGIFINFVVTFLPVNLNKVKRM